MASTYEESTHEIIQIGATLGLHWGYIGAYCADITYASTFLRAKGLAIAKKLSWKSQLLFKCPET